MSEYLSKSHSPPSPARSLCARQAARMPDHPTGPVQDLTVPRQSTLGPICVATVSGWRPDTVSSSAAARVMPSGASPASPAECMPTIPEAFQ